MPANAPQMILAIYCKTCYGENDDQCLNNIRYTGGNAGSSLHRGGTNTQGCEEDCYQNRCQRMQLTNQCHCDTIKAVSIAKTVNQTKLCIQKLRAAAKTGDCTRNHKTHQNILLYGKAIELGSGHIQTNCTQLKALRGVKQEIVHHQTNNQCNEESGCCAQTKNTAELGVVRYCGCLRYTAVAQPVGINNTHKQGRNIVEHDGNNHFILTTVDL